MSDDDSSDEPPEREPPREDVVLVGDRVEGGDGYYVLRKRDERLEVGELRAAKSGRPIHGELVRLLPREGARRVFDVQVLAPGPRRAQRDRAGPAQVSTEAYRARWDAVFGPQRRSKGELPS